MSDPRGSGEGGVQRLCPVALIPVLLFLLAACTLEQRFDPDLEEGAAIPADTVDDIDDEDSGSPVGAPAFTGLAPEDAVVTTLDVFREAVRVGDLSLALSLFHRDAILVDDLAHAVPAYATRGEVLMEVRRRHSEGLRLEVEEVSLQEFEGAWVVSTRVASFEADVDTSADPGAGRTWLRESALVVPSPEGWRIALFHRSEHPHLPNSGG